MRFVAPQRAKQCCDPLEPNDGYRIMTEVSSAIDVEGRFPESRIHEFAAELSPSFLHTLNGDVRVLDATGRSDW